MLSATVELLDVESNSPEEANDVGANRRCRGIGHSDFREAYFVLEVSENCPVGQEMHESPEGIGLLPGFLDVGVLVAYGQEQMV